MKKSKWTKQEAIYVVLHKIDNTLKLLTSEAEEALDFATQPDTGEIDCWIEFWDVDPTNSSMKLVSRVTPALLRSAIARGTQLAEERL